MNTMLEKLTDLDVRFRQHARAAMAAQFPNDAFTFELDEGIDASPNKAGPVFDQKRFWLLQLNIERGRRAGPGEIAPRRYWGSLDLALFVSGSRDKVLFTGMLETIANQIQDQTIQGIRFRTFVPTPTVPVRGFTSYNGVINFEFEINLTR